MRPNTAGTCAVLGLGWGMHRPCVLLLLHLATANNKNQRTGSGGRCAGGDAKGV